MLNKLKSYFTKTVYVAYRPHNEYHLVRNGKYWMHKGHSDIGAHVYQYGWIDEKPLVCHLQEYIAIHGETKFMPISLDALDPDAPITSSILKPPPA